jgi:enoyl-CoA hydratase/carnithine racemase
VREDQLARFTQTVIPDGVDSALAVHVVEPPNSSLLAQRDWIEKCYSAGTIVEIVTALAATTRSANDAATVIANRSPIAVAVTLEAIHRAAGLESLEHGLRQEYRMSCASLLRSHDLVEGIRAQVIERDGDPSWSPALLKLIKRKPSWLLHR